ncbi:unnamed protein product [Lampetra planeri]
MSCPTKCKKQIGVIMRQCLKIITGAKEAGMGLHGNRQEHRDDGCSHTATATLLSSSPTSGATRRGHRGRSDLKTSPGPPWGP